MKDMNLTNKLPNGLSWYEELPNGAVAQNSTQQYSANSGVRVLNIYIKWEDLAEAIAYICGYSQCLSEVTDQPFSEGLFQSQGPYYLSRKNPARHPQMPQFRATRILSVQGAFLDNAGRFTGVRLTDDNGVHTGTAGNWVYAKLSIQFEIPKYPILEDDEIDDGLGNFFPEYSRNCSFSFDVALETIARKGQTGTFAAMIWARLPFPATGSCANRRASSGLHGTTCIAITFSWEG
jgi:hypothetical protein